LNIIIVKPELKHTKAIAEICSAGWKQTVEGILSEEFQRKNIDFWYNHDRVYQDIEAGSYSYVALADSKVVGVIGGGMTAPKVGEVFVFYVDESYRYRGIGKRLLEALTADQINHDATEQWVSVAEGNQYGIPFYEARGFQYQKKRVTHTDIGEKQVSLRYLRQIAKT